MAVLVLLIRTDHDLYAVALTAIREVVVRPRLTRLPTAPAVFLGLFNVRGEIVPMLDTTVVTGTGTGTGTTETTATPEYGVVVETEAGPAALATTSLPVAVRLGDPIGPTELRGGVATYEHERELLVLLDPEVLLDPRRLGG